MRKILTILSLIAMITLPVKANAQGLPFAFTMDFSSLANSMKTLVQLQNQISQMQNMVQKAQQLLNVTNDINKAIGMLGANSGFFGGQNVSQIVSLIHLGYSLDQKGQNLISEGQSLFNQPFNRNSLLGNLGAIGQTISITTSNRNAQAKVQDIAGILQGTLNSSNSVSGLTRDLFSASSTPSSANTGAVQSARQSLVQYTATSGLATSAAAQTPLGTNATQDIGKLSQTVAQSTTERGDIQANSTIMIKVAEQLAAQNQILAKYLQVHAADTIMQLPVTNSSATSTIAQ